MTLLPPCAALAGALLVACPGAAQPPDQVSRHIAHADLDLSSGAGVAMLDQRIGIAVRDLCGAPSSSDIAGRRAVRLCRADARESIGARRRALIAAGAGARLAKR
ncbi:UrcA family protein [Sphingomonas profundi]|uniref:UrcA family protein n=1 Tax=Alterirhizorhabdus profundi TaxID=2681549 RepID=UPI0018D1DFB4|nr:UrcA family protein [Sphingomonas profundi]